MELEIDLRPVSLREAERETHGVQVLHTRWGILEVAADQKSRDFPLLLWVADGDSLACEREERREEDWNSLFGEVVRVSPFRVTPGWLTSCRRSGAPRSHLCSLRHKKAVSQDRGHKAPSKGLKEEGREGRAGLDAPSARAPLCWDQWAFIWPLMLM